VFYIGEGHLTKPCDTLSVSMHIYKYSKVNHMICDWSIKVLTLIVSDTQCILVAMSSFLLDILIFQMVRI
jgi:hypothetical protein